MNKIIRRSMVMAAAAAPIVAAVSCDVGNRLRRSPSTARTGSGGIRAPTPAGLAVGRSNLRTRRVLECGNQRLPAARSGLGGSALRRLGRESPPGPGAIARRVSGCDPLRPRAAVRRPQPMTNVESGVNLRSTRCATSRAVSSNSAVSAAVSGSSPRVRASSSIQLSIPQPRPVRSGCRAVRGSRVRRCRRSVPARPVRA